MKEYKRYGGVSKLYICPCCKKQFPVPFQTRGGGRTEWVFKRRRNRKMEYFCSYHCYHMPPKKEEYG